MRTTKKNPSPKPTASDPARIVATARAAAFTDLHPERAFTHFRPLAEKVSRDDLAVFNGDALVMRTNVARALDAIEPYLPRALDRLRDAPLREIFELPSLVMALDFSVGRVPVAKLSAGDIDAKLAEGGPWRELMLRYLEVASHPLLGLLPEERVRAVRRGTGKLDKARDFVALPGLFTEFGAALAGKHPFSEEAIARLGELGAALVLAMRSGRTPAESPKRTEESLLRDRFAALVDDRYDALQVLTAVAVGKREADALLPALRAAALPPVSTSADPAPAPDAAAQREGGDEKA